MDFWASMPGMAIRFPEGTLSRRNLIAKPGVISFALVSGLLADESLIKA